VIRSSQYGLSMPTDTNGTNPIVGMKNIQNGRVKIDPELRVDLTAREAEPYLLKDGDILLNRTNSPDLVGKTGIYRGSEKAVFASYLVRLELDRNQVDPDFVIQILASEGGCAKSGDCRRGRLVRPTSIQQPSRSIFGFRSRP